MTHWPKKPLFTWSNEEVVVQGGFFFNVLTGEVLGLKTIILGLATVQAMASRRIVRFAVGFCGPSSA